MTTTAPSDLDAPRPKIAMPPLDTRAPRPSVVRLRKGLVVGAVMAAAGLVGGSLAWAFVVQPELRARTHDARLAKRVGDDRGAVRPSERVTDGPSTYAQMGHLPEPRRIGGAQAPAAQPPPAPTPVRAQPTAARGLTHEARGSGLFFAGGRGAASPGAGGPVGTDGASGGRGDYGAVYNTHDLLEPLSPYEVKAGAVLAAALLTGIDTARAGPVTASVTENVFDSVTGRYLLIPQGARLVGRHEGESRHGDNRAYITWERLILPNGKSLVLPKEPGVDAQGAVGVNGQVDRRLLPLAVATLFAGAITTLGEVARKDDDHSGGLIGDAGDAASIQAAQTGGKLIDRELDVRPSIRLQPGARVRVFVTRDLVLEPYRP